MKHTTRDTLQTWLGIACMVAFVMTLALCSDAYARSKKICDPVFEDQCTQPIKKGEVAPFKGQLYTTALAIDQATKAHDCEESTDIAVGAIREPLQLRLDAEQRYRAIDARAAMNREDLFKDRLQEAHAAAERSWDEEPAFSGTIGFVLGVATTVGAVLLAVKIVKANQ